jgi:hypothetical protein
MMDEDNQLDQTTEAMSMVWTQIMPMKEQAVTTNNTN